MLDVRLACSAAKSTASINSLADSDHEGVMLCNDMSFTSGESCLRGGDCVYYGHLFSNSQPPMMDEDQVPLFYPQTMQSSQSR